MAKWKVQRDGAEWLMDKDGRVAGVRDKLGKEWFIPMVAVPWGTIEQSVVDPGGEMTLPAAQLAALAAAGGLTPYATYVASDTGATLRAVTASRLLDTSLGSVRPKICFFGDSLTQYNVGKLGSTATGGTTTIGIGINTLWADWTCPAGAGGAGAGQIAYNATAKTLTWTAAGDTAGAAVDASRSGLLKLPSGTAGSALYITWLPTINAYVTGTVDVAITASSQTWSGSGKGFGTSTLAAMQQPFDLATLPTGCPPGMDGFYGLGGAAATCLYGTNDSQWQWSQIVSDIDVIQVGTNDFSGSITLSEYITAVQGFITARLAGGTSMVIWTTIVPRNSESVTSKKNKAAAALAMRKWALTMGNRVAVWDLAEKVTNTTDGSYVTGATSDGVHLSYKGTLLIAPFFATFLGGFAGANSKTLPASFGDVWDTSLNPAGNILNTVGAGGLGTQVGSGGTIGTGAAGVCTTGYTLSRSTGATATGTGSKVTRADGVTGEWMQISMAGAITNERIRLITTSNIATALVVGETYQLEVEVRIVSSTSMNVLEATIAQNGVTARSATAFTSAGADTFPDYATPQVLWLKTPPAYVVAAGATSFSIDVQVGTSAGGSAVVQFGRIRFYRVSGV